jgi:cytochrome P450
MSSLALQYELSLTKRAWKLPTKTRRRTNKVINEVTAISDKVIHHCLSDNVPDVLVFKDAVTSQGKDYHDPDISKDIELWSFLRSIAGGYITAGFDTLSRSLAVTFAYLSLFPAVADLVREEVKRVMGDGEITADNVGSLHYTRAVFHEGLRYSGGILPIMTRQALKDDKIGDYEIKKNDRILFPLFYMGHLEQYWENPEAFDPSRFLGIDVMDERYRYVYVPFSTGVRGCSGRHFAALEGVIILAMILKKYRLDLLPLQKIDPDNPGTLAMTLHRIT